MQDQTHTYLPSSCRTRHIPTQFAFSDSSVFRRTQAPSIVVEPSSTIGLLCSLHIVLNHFRREKIFLHTSQEILNLHLFYLFIGVYSITGYRYADKVSKTDTSSLTLANALNFRQNQVDNRCKIMNSEICKNIN